MRTHPSAAHTGQCWRPQRRRLIAFAAIAIAVLAMFGPATTPNALAHSALFHSDPVPGDSLSESPPAITLWFTRDVDLASSRVTIVGADGVARSTGRLEMIGTSSAPAIRVPLNDVLSRGSYTVVYDVVSAVDGHASSGHFTFTVGDALMPSLAQQNALAGSVQSGSVIPDAATTSVRWLNLMAQSALGGVLLFLVALLIPARRVAGLPPVPSRRYRLLIAGLLVALVVGHLAALLFQSMTAAHAGSLSAALAELPRVLSETRVGIVWLIRSALLLALACLCWLLVRGAQLTGAVDRERWRWSAGLGIAAVLVLTSSLVSHAAGSDGSIDALLLVDWLHGMAAAVWFGGIVGLLVSFDLLPSGVARRAFLWRYARFALVALGTLILTGFVLARSEALSWDGLLSTDYGMWLLIKLVFVAGVIGVGAHHLLNVYTQIGVGSLEQQRRTSHWFPRTLRLEAAIAAIIVVVSSILVGTLPARDVLQAPGVLGSTRLVAETSITIRISPTPIGANEYSVVVSPSDPETFGVIAGIDLRFTWIDDQSASEVTTHLRQSGSVEARTFVGSGAFIEHEGNWLVTIVVQRDGFDASLDVPIGVTASDGVLSLTGVPAAESANDGRATAIGLAWLAIGLLLFVGAWRLHAQRSSMRYGLIGAGFVAMGLGLLLLAVGQDVFVR